MKRYLTSSVLRSRIRAIPMSGPPSMFDSPSPAPAATQETSYIQPTFSDGLRIWWALFWPTTLIAGILTAALHYSLRRVYQNSDIPGSVLSPIMRFDPYALTYIVALFVMDYVLEKNFRHFRLGLLSNRGGEGAQLLPVTLGRTLRVWWTYSWRSLIYRLILAFITTIPMGVILGLFTRMPVAHALVQFLAGISIEGAAGLFVIYSNILEEDFGDFRVCLLPRPKENAVPVTPAATPATN
jgi:hypothetical protein